MSTSNRPTTLTPPMADEAAQDPTAQAWATMLTSTLDSHRWGWDNIQAQRLAEPLREMRQLLEQAKIEAQGKAGTGYLIQAVELLVAAVEELATPPLPKPLQSPQLSER